MIYVIPPLKTLFKFILRGRNRNFDTVSAIVGAALSSLTVIMDNLHLSLLASGDEDELELYLTAYIDSSLFLLSNLRQAGIEFVEDRPYAANYWAVKRGRRVEGVIAHAWNGMVLLQTPGSYLPDLIGTLLTQTSRPVAGFLGPWEQVEQSHLIMRHHSSPQLVSNSREILYSLDLHNLEVPSGLSVDSVKAGLATINDLSELISLREAYNLEAIGKSGDEEESLRRMIAEESLYVLKHDGQIISLTGFNARLPEIVQVGGVYTPKAFRSCGYARAIVAFSLLHARELGCRKAVLFTGEDNIAAQTAYKALGFRPVGSYGMIFYQ